MALGKRSYNPLDDLQRRQQQAYQDYMRRQGTANFGGYLQQYAQPITMRPGAIVNLPGLMTGGTGTTARKPVAKKAPPKKIDKKVKFDSVIIPEEDKKAILSAIEQVENHELIFEKWGFGEIFEKGTAISMLFYGVPGTGKTLMAQAIADKLEKKLKVIGSAEIESSEPGGAERAIKAFFEGCKSDTILLFDECDSLIFDRSQVGSILAAQVNQLLGSLEKFTGIVIFTTNRLGHLDEAFNRRLSLKLEFKMPTKAQRVDIWKRMFPKKAPLDKNIDWELLADFEVSGGYIKNAVLRAARMAASEKAKKLTQSHLALALKAELVSMMEFENAKVNKPHLVGGGGYSVGSDMKKVIDMKKDITDGTS